MKKLTRIGAIKILMSSTDRNDPYWENLVDDFCDDFYDDADDSMPLIYDVLEAIGVSRAEIKEVEGY